MPRATRHELTVAWFERHVFFHPERRLVLARCLGDTDVWLKAVPSNLYPHYARTPRDRKIFRAQVRKVARDYCAVHPLNPPAPVGVQPAADTGEGLDQRLEDTRPAGALSPGKGHPLH